MRIFCFLHCIMDILIDGKTSYEKRYKAVFDGPLWPMGIEVKWQPQSAKDKERVHAFGDKRLEGIFVGYSQDPGGGWNENVIIIDKLDLETKSINQIHHRKCLWKEVEPMLEDDGEFIFPLADGDWPQPGIGDRALKMKERRDLRKAAKKEKMSSLLAARARRRQLSAAIGRRSARA